MAIKRYSPATIKTYVGLLTVFQSFVGKTLIQEIDTPALLNHILRIVEAKHYTYSSHKQLISAIALFLSKRSSPPPGRLQSGVSYAPPPAFARNSECM